MYISHSRPPFTRFTSSRSESVWEEAFRGEGVGRHRSLLVHLTLGGSLGWVGCTRAGCARFGVDMSATCVCGGGRWVHAFRGRHAGNSGHVFPTCRCSPHAIVRLTLAGRSLRASQHVHLFWARASRGGRGAAAPGASLRVSRGAVKEPGLLGGDAAGDDRPGQARIRHGLGYRPVQAPRPLRRIPGSHCDQPGRGPGPAATGGSGAGRQRWRRARGVQGRPGYSPTTSRVEVGASMESLNARAMDRDRGMIRHEEVGLPPPTPLPSLAI